MFLKRKKKPLFPVSAVELWRLDAGEYVRQIASSPKGVLFAIATADSSILLVDPKTGEIKHRLSGHDDGVTSLCWHPTLMQLASAGHDGHVRYWDASSGEQLWSAEAGNLWAERVVFNRSGSTLAVAAGRAVRLIDCAGKLIRELPDHPSTIADIAWRPDKDELVVARYGGLTIWDIAQEIPVKSLNYRGSVLRISICPRGRYIATADQNSAVHFWRTESWLDAEMAGYPHLVTSISWDSTGNCLVTDGGVDAFVWDCSDPGPEEREPTFLKGFEDQLTRCVAFAPNSMMCATAGESGVVAVYNVTDSKCCEVSHLGESVCCLTWLQDSTTLVAGTTSGTIVGFGH